MTTSTPYKSAAKTYLKRGWKPLPVEGKFPPRPGATGREGTVTPEKVADWRQTHGGLNVGLRAEGWVALDVDHYADKSGADTLAEWEARLGALPPTFRSTARGIDNPSGQRFYQVPEDTEFVQKIGADIDIIQRSHRYSMVAPSIHPSGRAYQWYDPSGAECDIPEVMFLPELPGAWIDALTREPNAPLLSGVEVIPWRQLAEDFPTGSCLASDIFRTEVDDLTAKGHVGHDDALRLALRGFMLGREGHSGLADHLAHLHAAFAAYIASKRDRDKREPDFVFRDMAEMAQRKAVVETCRCPRAGELADSDLTGVVDPNLAVLLASPIQIPGTKKVDLKVAATRFVHDHPVRRHRGSNGALYLWTGDRWEVANVGEYVYRWLAEALANDVFTGRAADELTRYILTHAPLFDEKDIDTRYISCANGLLDWQTGELRPRTKDVFTFNHLPIAWRPGARPGRFREWIATAIDEPQQGAIWEVLGYAVSPVHDLKVALALTGPGGGGKSTFINVLSELVGPENVAAVAPNQLGERFMKAELFGKTVNAIGDVGAETLKHLGMFKAIVAGDSISAEYKGKDPFRYRPRTFSVASFNVLPAVEQSDSAFWDRWLVLKFAKRFNRGGTPDNYFRDRMPHDRAVMEGVLVEAVTALQRLRDRRGFDADVFGPAKDEWRAQVDSIASFVTEHLAVDAQGMVSGDTLYGAYKTATEREGGMPKKRTGFYRDLSAYLDERYPGRAFRQPTAPGRTVQFVGVKYVIDDHGGDFDAAPGATWGARGWTKRV